LRRADRPPVGLVIAVALSKGSVDDVTIVFLFIISTR
jgi:hypothetical protein